MNSIFGTLGKSDLLKGLLIAVLASLMSGTLAAINAGTIEFTWVFFKPIVLASISAGLAYILKNWLSNSEGKFLKSEE